jgi:hypothetical protein
MNLLPEQEKLALEIANALDDMEALQVHRRLVCKYSEEYLRKRLTKALAVPHSQIRKSRGALYTSLVQGYGSYPRS